MGNSTQRNETNGVPPLAEPTVLLEEELRQAKAWILILLDLDNQPVGERWHIRACAEEFANTRNEAR